MTNAEKIVPTMLNIEDSIDFLLKEVSQLGADKADILVVDDTHIAASVRDGKKETIERSESLGLGLRILVGKQSAVASISDTSTDSLLYAAHQVVDMAKLAPADPYVDIPDLSQTLSNDRDKQLDLYDEKEPTIESLLSDAEILENQALQTKGITNSEGAVAAHAKSRIWLANSYGFLRSHQSSISSLSISVLAEKNGNKERDYAYTQARHREDLDSISLIAEEVTSRTLARLGARQVKTGAFPVVFEPRVSKSLIGILVSACNGASVAKKTSFLKDKMQQNICPPHITIINDPLIQRGLGSDVFDAEGIETKMFPIIDQGVLSSWVLDTRSANQLGLITTGNASRGLSSAPSPSSHNVYLKPSDVSPADLIADIKQGFFVTETFGSGINMITGDYSQGASGFWIENGKITYPVNEVTIAGNLTDMFMQMSQADDLTFKHSKNAPTIRIERMTVAGE